MKTAGCRKESLPLYGRYLPAVWGPHILSQLPSLSLNEPGRGQKDVSSELNLGINLEVIPSQQGFLFAFVFGRKNRKQPVERFHPDPTQDRD